MDNKVDVMGFLTATALLLPLLAASEEVEATDATATGPVVWWGLTL